MFSLTIPRIMSMRRVLQGVFPEAALSTKHQFVLRFPF